MKTAAAGAAAAGVAGMAGKGLLGQMFPPGVQAAKKPPPPERIPINSAIIIGAGISGLTAASLIHDHGDTVTVIEDCHRPGGRIQVGTFPNGQHFSAAGSEWFACDTEFKWLVSDYLGFANNKIGTWSADTYYWWQNQYCFCSGGWTGCINNCLPLDDPDSFWDYETASKKFYDCILTEPWDADGSCYLGSKKWPADITDYQDHITTKYDASMADMLGNVWFKSELGVPPTMAAESVGNYCMAYWYWDNCYSLKDGNYQIIEQLMSGLPAGSVKLNETVTSVTNTGAPGVQVETNKGTYTADVAIVAVPHTKAASIVPELPSARVDALAAMHDTHNILAALQFTERFWDTQYGMKGWGGSADWLTTTDATMFQTGAEGILECYICENESLGLWQTRKGIHVRGADKDPIVDAILAKLDEFWPATQYYNGNAKVYEHIPYVPNYPVGFVRDGTYATLRDPIDRIEFGGDYAYGPGLNSAVHRAMDIADKYE